MREDYFHEKNKYMGPTWDRSEIPALVIRSIVLFLQLLSYTKQNILPYEIFRSKERIIQMNNDIFNTKNELSKRIQSNVLFVALVELTIYSVGLRIMYLVQAFCNFFTPLVGEKYTLYYNANFWLIIPS